MGEEIYYFQNAWDYSEGPAKVLKSRNILQSDKW